MFLNDIYLLKYPYSCFSSYSCFLVIVVPFIIVLLALFLVAVVFTYSIYEIFVPLYWCIHAIFNVDESSTYFFSWRICLSISSLRCKALCIVISFLAILSIRLSSSIVHFKYGPEDLTKREYTGVYHFDMIPAVELCFEMFSRSSEVHFPFFFPSYPFDGARFQYSQELEIFLFFQVFWFFLNLTVLLLVFFHYSLWVWYRVTSIFLR